MVSEILLLKKPPLVLRHSTNDSEKKLYRMERKYQRDHGDLPHDGTKMIAGSCPSSRRTVFWIGLSAIAPHAMILASILIFILAIVPKYFQWWGDHILPSFYCGWPCDVLTRALVAIQKYWLFLIPATVGVLWLEMKAACALMQRGLILPMVAGSIVVTLVLLSIFIVLLFGILGPMHM